MTPEALKAILTDTSWALVVTDIATMDENQSEASVHTSLRVMRLRKAGLKITTGGVMQEGGYISPAFMIHNISPTQLESMRESDPPLILCPSYLHFKSGLTVHPDLSTCSVYQGSLVRESSHLETHMIRRGNKTDLHLGMYSDLNLIGLPKDDPAIPWNGSSHNNCFIYTARASHEPDKLQENVSRMCNIRNLDFDEQVMLFTKEAHFNRHTAKTQRFRRILTDCYVKLLKDPLVFGFRYRDKEGNYV